MNFAASSRSRGRVSAGNLLLVVVVVALALALLGLAWRALSAGQDLREAFAQRNQVLAAIGDLKFRVASLRARQLEYVLQGLQGPAAAAAAPPGRAAFQSEADALGRNLNELLALRLTSDERSALEDLHAQLLAFLKTDGQLLVALKVADPQQRQPLVDTLATSEHVAQDMTAAVDRLSDAELKQDAARGDNLYARARGLRALVTGTVLCGVLLGAVLLFSWGSAMRRQASMTTKMEQFSLIDESTGLPNRRAWSERLTAEIARAIRQASTLSLVLLDTEAASRGGARRDAGGHSQVARAWKAALRRDDYIARLAATRFAFILPACDAAQAAAMAERLHALAPGAKRFAAGVASWDRRETAEHLMGRAEEALKRARAASATPSIVLAEGREAQAGADA
jgi:diguanylate cyclase (GGDEF)-like protein